MAHCEEYIELISAAVDGALSSAEQEKLTAHLASCPECQKLFDDLSALHAAMDDLPPAVVPADLKDRIMDAVAAEKIVPLAPKRPTVHWQRWLASAAVLALVVMGTWSWKPWENSADLPRADEAAGRGMDSASYTVTGTAGTADGAAPAVPAPEPSEAQPSNLPAPASVPLDVSALPADPAAESADAPAEKNSVRSAKVSPSSDGDASVTAEVPTVQSTPAEFGDTISPQSAVMPRLFSAPIPSDAGVSNGSGDSQPTAAPRVFSVSPASQPLPVEEGILVQAVTSQEDAVHVLADYIYEFVGDVTVLDGGPDAGYAVNSPTGVSGTVTCVDENEEAYFLNYKDDLSPDPLLYSVNKQTGEVTLLEKEELPGLPAEESAP